MTGRLLLWRLRGAHRSSPFFDPKTGEPSAVPHVLTDEERRQIESAREAA